MNPLLARHEKEHAICKHCCQSHIHIPPPTGPASQCCVFTEQMISTQRGFAGHLTTRCWTGCMSNLEKSVRDSLEYQLGARQTAVGRLTEVTLWKCGASPEANCLIAATCLICVLHPHERRSTAMTAAFVYPRTPATCHFLATMQ